jgi:hypothetical protein
MREGVNFDLRLRGKECGLVRQGDKDEPVSAGNLNLIVVCSI